MAQKTRLILTCDRCDITLTEEIIPGKPQPDMKFFDVILKPLAGGNMIMPGEICNSCREEFFAWWEKKVQEH